MSTTGDTGPAAIRAVRDAEKDRPSGRVRIVVAHPAGQISDLQRRQMTTVEKGD